MPSEEGFYDKQTSGTTYITILGTKDDKGKPTARFIEKVREGDEGAVSRKNKMDEIVWERHHKGFWLSLKKVYLDKKNKFGTQLCLRGKSKTIQVAFKSEHARKFIAVCGNIDITEPILLEPYRFQQFDDDDKPKLSKKGEKTYRNGWTIKQGGDTKDHKLEDSLDMSKNGDVPKWKKLKNGTWDTSDQDEFLEEHLEEWIKRNKLNEDKPSVTEDDDDNDNEEEEEEQPDASDEEEEEAAPPPPKKVSGKVVSTKPLKKTQVVEDEEEEEIP